MKKYKLTTNLPLKIIAFVFAAFLWLIVANVANPVTKSTYTNIKVTIANEDVITQGGEVYTVLDDQNVNVVVYAKRSVIQQIKSDDIVATADIKEMDSRTGLVPISVSIPKYSGSYQSAESVPRNIQIKTEPTGKNVFTLTVSTTGTQRDGYQIGEMKVNPEKITITGAESTVKAIDKAVAKINVDGISKDEELTAELVLYDSSGNVINQGQLSNNLGEDGITVDVTVLRIKTVPLKFEASGTPADGYVVSKVDYSPKLLTISGSKNALANISTVSIPSRELDITGASSNKTFDIAIEQYLPEGITLSEGQSGTISVTIELEQLQTESFQIDANQFQLVNTKPEYEYELIDPALTLTLQALQADLDSFNPETLQGTIDVGGLEAGEYINVPVTLTLDSAYTMMQDLIVSVRIIDKTAQTEAQETESTTVTESTVTTSTQETSEASSQTVPETTQDNVSQENDEQ